MRYISFLRAIKKERREKWGRGRDAVRGARPDSRRDVSRQRQRHLRVRNPSLARRCARRSSAPHKSAREGGGRQYKTSRRRRDSGYNLYGARASRRPTTSASDFLAYPMTLRTGLIRWRGKERRNMIHVNGREVYGSRIRVSASRRFSTSLLVIPLKIRRVAGVTTVVKARASTCCIP